MKYKIFFLSIVSLIIVTMSFVSCEEDEIDDSTFISTGVINCDSVEVGDTCFWSVTLDNGQVFEIGGTVDEECECDVYLYGYCPDLNLTFGDTCFTDNNESGIVNNNCECLVADCPDLGLNIGDVCDTGNDGIHIVDTNCNCTFTPYDCIDLQGFAGDSCMVNNYQGIITPDCDCEVDVVWDCPDVSLNVGDSCVSVNSLPGYIDVNCDCIEENPWDCPELQTWFGTVCSYIYDNNGTPVTVYSSVNTNCECEELECPLLNDNIGDNCSFYVMPVPGDTLSTIIANGVVNADCNCEAPVDCFSLGMQVGDTCYVSGQIGLVNDNCECETW